MLWRDEYCIGDERIDGQHRELFRVLNRILQIIGDDDNERSKRACVEAVKYLKSYTLDHFNDEEQFQLRIGYKGYPQHKRQHEAFKGTMAGLETDLTENDFSKDSVRRFVGALSSWLVYHIMDSDQAITGQYQQVEHTGSNSVIMERIILDSLKRMFRVDVVIGNVDYKGGFTGNEIYCITDVSYAEESLRILIAMDINIAVAMASNMLDMKLSEVDELVLSAVQELSLLLSVRFAQEYGNGRGCHINEIAIAEKDAAECTPDETQLLSMLFDAPMGNLVVKIYKK